MFVRSHVPIFYLFMGHTLLVTAILLMKIGSEIVFQRADRRDVVE